MKRAALVVLAIGALTTSSERASAQTTPQRMTKAAILSALRTPESFANLIDPSLGFAWVERLSEEGPQVSRSRRVCGPTVSADTARLRQQLRSTIRGQSDGDPFSCRNSSDGSAQCSIGIGGEGMGTHELFFVRSPDGKLRLDAVVRRSAVYYAAPDRRNVTRELARQRAAACESTPPAPWTEGDTRDFPWHTLVFRRQIKTGFCTENLGIADDGTLWRERGCEARSQSQRGRTISTRELAAIRAAFAALPTTEPTCRSEPGQPRAGELSFVARTVAGSDYASSVFKTWPVCAPSGAYAPVDAGFTDNPGAFAALERLFAAL